MASGGPAAGCRRRSTTSSTALGRPLTLLVGPGQAGDSPMLPHLLDGLRVPRPCAGRPRTRPDALLADKAYCAREHRLKLTARGIKVVIPERDDQIRHRKNRGPTGGRPPPWTPSSTNAATSSNAPSTSTSNGADWPPATTSTPSPTAPASSSPPSSPGSKPYWETCPSGASPQPDERCGVGPGWFVGSGRGSHGEQAPRHGYRSMAVGGPGADPRPELMMTVARSVADVLDDHVSVRARVHRPDVPQRLPAPAAARERGGRGSSAATAGRPIASSALMDPITKDFVAAITRFAQDAAVPMVRLRQGAAQGRRRARAPGPLRGGRDEGVLFVGRAQEKTPRVPHRETPQPRHRGDVSVDRALAPAMVNHFYFYCVDADFGPFFLKFCTYFPYNAKLCLNGHEYAKRQPAKAGIAFEALDNGFASCADPAGGCRALRPAHRGPRSTRCCASGWRDLPHPFTRADRAPATATTSPSCRPSSP